MLFLLRKSIITDDIYDTYHNILTRVIYFYKETYGGSVLPLTVLVRSAKVVAQIVEITLVQKLPKLMTITSDRSYILSWQKRSQYLIYRIASGRFQLAKYFYNINVGIIINTLYSKIWLLV